MISFYPGEAIRLDETFQPPPIYLQMRPASYLLLSVVTCIFCNWILGFIAIIFSRQFHHPPRSIQITRLASYVVYLFAVVISSSAADGGDMEGARKMGRVAFWLNIASYIIAAVAIISAIIWFVVSVTTAASSTGVECGSATCLEYESCCSSSFGSEPHCC